MQDFTVILLFPDYLADSFGQDTYSTDVSATDSIDAVRVARKEATEGNDMPETDGHHFYCIACLQGHVTFCETYKNANT